MEPTQFVHHKLHVYNLAIEMLREVHRAVKTVPRGYRGFADQLLRAAAATAALTGEGANRFSTAQKRQRFAEARGEAGEVAVHIESLRIIELIDEDTAQSISQKADRICAMLTKLIIRHQ